MKANTMIGIGRVHKFGFPHSPDESLGSAGKLLFS